jgi:hypothetical protein
MVDDCVGISFNKSWWVIGFSDDGITIELKLDD